MNRTVRTPMLVAVCLGVVLAWTGAPSNPGTNLNDIPIAEVLAWRSVEFSAWVTTGEREEPVWWGVVNVGLLDYAEVGLYNMLGPSDEDQGDLRFFGKFVYPLGEGMPNLGAGLQNVTGDEDDNGNIDPYLVVAHDFGPVRGHLGYSFQDDDEAFFAGLDTSFDFLESPAMVGLTVLQTDDGDEWLISAGFEYQLPMSFVLESWYTWTTVDEAENTITIRLNWVVAF
jgi:hypothetical protein